MPRLRAPSRDSVGRELHVVATTLSPGFQGKLCATRFNPQLVFGKKRDLVARRPEKARRLLAGVVDEPANQSRQWAAPRSRTFARCAERVRPRRGSGATRRVVEVDEVAADRELAVEARGGEVEAAHVPGGRAGAREQMKYSATSSTGTGS